VKVKNQLPTRLLHDIQIPIMEMGSDFHGFYHRFNKKR
jgi:hypothetical protein